MTIHGTECRERATPVLLHNKAFRFCARGASFVYEWADRRCEASIPPAPADVLSNG
jgi:hypothetical protein